MITLETVENIIREYFNLQLSPNDQPEPRSLEYVDIKGVRDEIFEWIKLLPINTILSEFKTIIRNVLRLAELKADDDRFFRLSIYHVNLALQEVFSTYNKI